MNPYTNDTVVMWQWIIGGVALLVAAVYCVVTLWRRKK